MSPHFDQVPDYWKAPIGPYRQAPAEYGGGWWLVNPFTSAEPWVSALREGPQHEDLPPGFEEIFGPRPQAGAFLGSANPSLLYRTAVVQWEQDLRYFRQSGAPEWADAGLVETAANVFRSWEMGTPRFYEGRYGWMARFPESVVPDFEIGAWAALFSTHLVIAQFQLELIERNVTPKQQHPFVPPQLWPSGDQEVKEGQ
ncbi:MAG: hypothetical protein GC160_19530 [Acidobacteria bacterium]|nr:hypothetical protein [Acidobacteriota bacterium]